MQQTNYRHKRWEIIGAYTSQKLAMKRLNEHKKMVNSGMKFTLQKYEVDTKKGGKNVRESGWRLLRRYV